MKTIVMVLACALPLAAQSGSKADSTKAATIVARHIAAVGGAAAFRAIRQMHTVVTMSMPAPGGGSEVRSEVWAKVPNLVYMKMHMPGMGAMEMGYDGEIAWTMSAVTGPMIHDDIPEQLLGAVDFAAVPFEGLAVTYVGRRQIGGRSLDAVRAIMPDSSRVTHYFDVATGLLAGMDPDDAPPPPPDRMMVTFEDYRRIGGILQAHRVTTVAQGQEIVVRTVSLSHAPFDVKIFEWPPAVRQLRDKPPER